VVPTAVYHFVLFKLKVHTHAGARVLMAFQEDKPELLTRWLEGAETLKQIPGIQHLTAGTPAHLPWPSLTCAVIPRTQLQSSTCQGLQLRLSCGLPGQGRARGLHSAVRFSLPRCLFAGLTPLSHSPVHQTFVKEYVAPVREDLLAMDFEAPYPSPGAAL
jgi:hypothetical protein